MVNEAKKSLENEGWEVTDGLDEKGLGHYFVQCEKDGVIWHWGTFDLEKSYSQAVSALCGQNK